MLDMNPIFHLECVNLLILKQATSSTRKSVRFCCARFEMKWTTLTKAINKKGNRFQENLFPISSYLLDL